MLKKLVSFSLLLFFTTGCANQAAFMSSPAGAQVFVDGKSIGVTPCVYQYKSNSGKTCEVVIKKDGYDTVQEEVQADQIDKPARKKWMTAGLVWSPLWLGTFFTKKLKDAYNYTLKKSGPNMHAQVQTPVQEQAFKNHVCTPGSCSVIIATQKNHTAHTSPPHNLPPT